MFTPKNISFLAVIYIIFLKHIDMYTQTYSSQDMCVHIQHFKNILEITPKNDVF